MPSRPRGARRPRQQRKSRFVTLRSVQTRMRAPRHAPKSVPSLLGRRRRAPCGRTRRGREARGRGDRRCGDPRGGRTCRARGSCGRGTSGTGGRRGRRRGELEARATAARADLEAQATAAHAALEEAKSGRRCSRKRTGPSRARRLSASRRSRRWSRGWASTAACWRRRVRGWPQRRSGRPTSSSGFRRGPSEVTGFGPSSRRRPRRSRVRNRAPRSVTRPSHGPRRSSRPSAIRCCRRSTASVTAVEELEALKTAVEGHESQTRRAEEELHGVRQELETTQRELGSVREEISQREQMVSASSEELERLRVGGSTERAGPRAEGRGAPRASSNLGCGEERARVTQPGREHPIPRRRDSGRRSPSESRGGAGADRGCGAAARRARGDRVASAAGAVRAQAGARPTRGGIRLDPSGDRIAAAAALRSGGRARRPGDG